MGFLDLIEKIQKKPAKTREKILVASVAVIMAVIILVWLQTARSAFLEKSPKKSAGEAGPLQILNEALDQSIKIFKEQFNF